MATDVHLGAAGMGLLSPSLFRWRGPRWWRPEMTVRT